MIEKDGIEKTKKGRVVVTILGPTACGKTSLATHLAYDMGGEIISADSRQVYRGMDIGTGKDIDDYSINGVSIPFHLIDIVPAGYKYNLFEYQHDFLKALSTVEKRSALPILCGGTGLYIESVLKGYNMIDTSINKPLREELKNKTLPELRAILSQYKSLHNTTDTQTIERAMRAIEIADFYKKNNIAKTSCAQRVDSVVFGIDIDRDKRRELITERLKLRLETGMIVEIEGLLKSGVSAETLIYYGLEYRFVTNYLLKKIDYKTMFAELEIAIHQFAKRQMTWFRGMERRGFSINWLNFDLSTYEKIEKIKQVMTLR